MSQYQTEAKIAMLGMTDQALANYDAMTAAQKEYTQSISEANATEESTIAANQEAANQAALMQSALEEYATNLDIYNGDAETAINEAASSLSTNAEEYAALKQQLTEALTDPETGELKTTDLSEVYSSFLTMQTEAQNAIEQAKTDAETAREAAAQALTDTMNTISANAGLSATELAELVSLATETGATIDTTSAEMAVSVQGMVEGVATNLKSGGAGAAAAASEMIGKVSTAVSDEKANAGTSGKSVGRAITDGITSGLNNGTGALYSAVRNIVNQAISIARVTADVNSPSKKMRDLVGKPLMEGLTVGVESEQSRVIKSVRSSVSKVISGAASVVNKGTYTTPALAFANGGGIDYQQMSEVFSSAMSELKLFFNVGKKQLAQATSEDNARQAAIRARSINIGKGRW